MRGREISAHIETLETSSMQNACYTYVALSNLRTDNIWFWDTLQQVSHAFHPFLAFFCCLCGNLLSSTCADDLKSVWSLSPHFCFNLLNTQNISELKKKLGLKASHKFSVCVIEGNSFETSSILTSQYSPECCMSLTIKKENHSKKQNCPSIVVLQYTKLKLFL